MPRSSGRPADPHRPGRSDRSGASGPSVPPGRPAGPPPGQQELPELPRRQRRPEPGEARLVAGRGLAPGTPAEAPGQEGRQGEGPQGQEGNWFARPSRPRPEEPVRAVGRPGGFVGSAGSGGSGRPPVEPSGVPEWNDGHDDGRVRVEFAGPPAPRRRPGPPAGQGGRGHRGQGPRRSGGKSRVTLVAAITASVLAIGTGVAIDRLVLPEMRSEPAAASKPAPLAADPTPGTNLDQREAAGGSAPAPTPSESAPPLKPLPATGRATPTPDTSKSDAPDKKKPTGGSGGGGAIAGSSVAETAVALLTNKERAAKGCSALRIDARLVASARGHSKDMAANDYFSHTSRNGDSPWKRMEEAGYTSPGAENIAKGYPTPAAVVEGWMKSPGHRANILNCDLRAIGVGMADGSGCPYWTQNFGWK
ncbi:CAP domain-containing protein [Actinomadura sp. 9N407]|uniref:CAP domain-containing protein n=1 Tax=Actinomadura sp. 9N407 TaxID=3375154 RepID=UPI0037A6768C